MANVEWIKIATDIFDDEKILLIESKPGADAIINIWFKLLCLAGKMNNSGVFVMANGIAYTDDMLATIFRKPKKTVKAAFAIFEEYGMIERIDGAITIPNWGKHQNLDKIEKNRDYQREYMKSYRQKQKDITKTLQASESKPNCKTNSNPNVRDIEGEKDKDIDKDKKESKEKKVYTPPSEEDRKAYGPWKNVMLTDAELQVLQNQYPNWQALIDNFSEKIKAKGYTYANHCAAICAWEKKDRADRQKAKDGMMTHGYDYDKIFGSTG